MILLPCPSQHEVSPEERGGVSDVKGIKWSQLEPQCDVYTIASKQRRLVLAITVLETLSMLHVSWQMCRHHIYLILKLILLMPPQMFSVILLCVALQSLQQPRFRWQHLCLLLGNFSHHSPLWYHIRDIDVSLGGWQKILDLSLSKDLVDDMFWEIVW